MGDRVTIVLTDGVEVSPSIYLHWGGEGVETLLQSLKGLMEGREADLDYSAARLVGLCHENTPGNLSLGIWNTGPELSDAILKTGDPEVLENASPGDAGLVVVNLKGYRWRAFGGYLAEPEDAA